jgi:hypothetical protein
MNNPSNFGEVGLKTPVFLVKGFKVESEEIRSLSTQLDGTIRISTSTTFFTGRPYLDVFNIPGYSLFISEDKALAAVEEKRSALNERAINKMEEAAKELEDMGIEVPQSVYQFLHNLREESNLAIPTFYEKM